MKYRPIEGIEGFRRILELTKPVGDSREIWLKLGHDKFVVGDYTKDGNFPIWETKGSGKNRKRTRQHNDCWEYVSNWAKNNDGGVFFIPTQPQGYPLKEQIALSDDIAAELDEGTPEEQWAKIAEFVEISGLEPAYIIHSGSKSYHPHWKALEHLPIAQTIYVRQLVCIALSSDPAIANAHQPMRMAGFYRKEKGREQTLEYSSEARYSYKELIEGIKAYFEAKDLPFLEEISEERWRIYKRNRRNANLDRHIFNEQEKELYPEARYSKTLPPSNVYSIRIPLDLAISKANQLALRGVGSDRNQTRVALAKDLIGCYEWLKVNNYEVEGDPYQLFIKYCQYCAPGGGWGEREWSTIWRSARRGNPTPARGDLSKFIHWYRWENDPEYREALESVKIAAEHIKPNSRAYEEYIAWEEEQEKIESAIEKSELQQWLEAKAKGLGKNFRKGFGQYGRFKKPIVLPETIKYRPNSPLPTPEDYEGRELPRIKFKKGQRHPVIVKLSKLGWKYLLDRSFMGLGKSYDMGNFANQSGKTWYLDLNHRNPSTATVEKNFIDLEVRHNGLNHDENRTKPSGEPYSIWAKEDEHNPDVKSLCHNAHLFIGLNNKGYPVDSLKDKDEEGSINPICKSCKFHKWKAENERGETVAICAAQKGDGYGFRYARKEGLNQERIRASLDSLPGIEEYDYSQDIAIVDEASRIIKGSRTIRAIYQDFLVKMMELEKIPEVFSALKPYREILNPLLSGVEKLPRYGLNHEQIIKLFDNKLFDQEKLIYLLEIIASTSPELQQILVEAVRHKAWGKGWKASIRTANWFERMEAKQETMENINNLPSNFLIDFLSVLCGLISGAIRINSRRQLLITTEDKTHGDKLKEFKQVILLDATANKRILAQRIGIEANSIIEIEEELPPLKNLTVINLQIEGLGSSQYSDQALTRVSALIKKIEEYGETAILGLKKYWSALDLDGNWFNDNRGSNRFKAKKTIVTVGTPYINVGAVEDEYLTLFGNLDGFDEYYQSLIEAEITQLVGRPRAHLYPEQEFLIYMIGTDQQLDYLRQYGINVINRHGFEITPEAGTRGQMSKYKFLRAISAITNQFGSKQINRKTIAEETGLSEEYIKKIVKGLGGIKAFRKWVQSLYDSNRGSTHLFSPEFLLDDQKIRGWLNLEPRAAIKDLVEMIVNCGWKDFLAYLDCFSGDVGAKMWGLIAPLFFEPSVMEELVKITDG